VGDGFRWMGGGEVDVRVRGRVAGIFGSDHYSAWEGRERTFYNLEEPGISAVSWEPAMSPTEPRRTAGRVGLLGVRLW